MFQINLFILIIVSIGVLSTVSYSAWFNKWKDIKNNITVCSYLWAVSYNNTHKTCRFINKSTWNEKYIKIRDLKYYINY